MSFYLSAKPKMNKKLAKKIVLEFQLRHGPIITIDEAMSMERIISDGHTIYAFNKGEVTFLARIKGDRTVSVRAPRW
jgi:hypothetical protein